MILETVSQVRSHGGIQGVYAHPSAATGTMMTFAVFVPEHEPGTKLPVLTYLSGLTCTHANVMEKGEYRAAYAEHGIVFVTPDTSPRGPDLAGNAVPDDANSAYDFGLGAGFYVDATLEPWAQHYQMETYITQELPALIAAHFPVDVSLQAIMGHSMGGHGAITLALRHPEQYRSISAFAPIVAPMQCPWGQKALGGYLGPDQAIWAAHDACALIAGGARLPDLLVDQGDADAFLDAQLKTRLLVDACKAAAQSATIRVQPGYDHSYYFISTFMADHIAWHAARLK